MNKNNVYIIGEIGQNHNGSLDIAKLLIDAASRPVTDKLFGKQLKPINAIKLTKRDLTQELSPSQMKKAYKSIHSFGITYGEHRKALELTDEQHFSAYQYAKSKDLDFVETITAIGAMSLLKFFQPDYLKVASRDLTNLPLLAALAETKLPIILSTGMAGKKELDKGLETISKYHSNISILHCISQYPTEYSNVNLNTIRYLLDNYGQYTIGYSDHTIGIATPIAAVAMGAKIIEKHITLDRKMKGTDQAGSLGIDGIERMVRDIRNLEMSFGEEDIRIESAVKEARIKLERSIAVNKTLAKGYRLTENDLHMLSPGDGFQWDEKEKVVGKKLVQDILKDEIIYSNILE